MENEVPMSQPPLPQPELDTPEVAPPAYPDIEAMKAKARELAIQQFLASKGATAQVPPPAPQPQQPPQPIPVAREVQREFPQPVPPKIIYLRRNLTVAELIVVFAISCGLVWGIPTLWQFGASKLPQIEIKVK